MPMGKMYKYSPTWQEGRKIVKVKAVKVSKAVKKFVAKRLKKDKELCYVTQEYLTQTATTSTPYFNRLSGTVQGANEGNRIGNQVHGQWLNTNIRIFTNAAQVSNGLVRIIIFGDNKQQGVIATGADLLQDYNTDAKDYLRHINRKTVDPKRWHIYKDIIVKLDPETSVGVTAATPQFTPTELKGNDKTFRFHIPLKNKRIDYIGTTNAQASDGVGNIYIAFFCNLASNAPGFDIQSEFVFTE